MVLLTVKATTKSESQTAWVNYTPSQLYKFLYLYSYCQHHFHSGEDLYLQGSKQSCSAGGAAHMCFLLNQHTCQAFHLSLCSLTCCPEQGIAVWVLLHLYSLFISVFYIFPVKTAPWQVMLKQVSQNWQEHDTGVYHLTEVQKSNGLWTSGHFWDFLKCQYHSFPLLMGFGRTQMCP